MDEHAIQHEVFARFAEHLLPEAFASPTRAARVTRETAGPMSTGGSEPRNRLDRWTAARIEDALAASWPHDRPLVVAFTSDGHLLRRYDENGCGHLDGVMSLVRDEVAAIDEVLRPLSSSRWTATWYAEARGGGLADTSGGYLHLDGEEVTAAGPLHVRATAATREFHRMLYRHPARRLHPLRRR